MASAEFTFTNRMPNLGKSWMTVKKRVLRSWSQWMLKVTHQRFRDQISPDGTPWAPHADLTKRRLGEQMLAEHRKRKSAGSRIDKRLQTKYGKILYRTGDLFRRTAAVFGDDEVWLWNSLPYAWVHNEGATFQTTPKQSKWMWANLFGGEGNPFRFKKLTIPKRQFLGFGPEDPDYLADIAVSHGADDIGLVA